MQEEPQVQIKTPSFLDEPEDTLDTNLNPKLETEPEIKEEVADSVSEEEKEMKEEIKEISFGTPPPELVKERESIQESRPRSPIKETKRERSPSPIKESRSRSPVKETKRERSPSPIKESRHSRSRSRSRSLEKETQRKRSVLPIKESRSRSPEKETQRKRSVSPDPESEEEIEEPTVYRCGEINPKYMEFKKPVKRTGSYFIEIGYKGENMYVQTNKVRVVSSKSKFGKFELDEELYNLITRTDTRIQNVCAERSKEFFKGKEISIEQIEYGYKTPVQILNGYRSKLCSSIFVLSGSENVQIYNNKLENITLDKVKEDDYAKILLKLSGVNITPREIQPVWEIVQMKTYTKMNISKPFFVQEETYPEADMISRM